MPCLLGIFALFLPRVVIVVLWFFTDWFQGVFNTLLWPILGLIFAPTTLLWYSFVVNYYGGQWGLIQIIGAVVAILIDFSPASSRRR
jgi:hypothetical protein